MSRRSVLVAVLGLVVASGVCGAVVRAAGGEICPVAFTGQWSGRYYYYCLSGSGANECAGMPVGGSDTAEHAPLGCVAMMCSSPIGSSSTSVEELHANPGGFDGATDNIDLKGSLAVVVSDFHCKIKKDGQERVVRVLLVTHPKMFMVADGFVKPIPVVLAQELKDTRGVMVVNEGAEFTAMRQRDDQVWKFDIPAKHFGDNWKGTDTSIKNWFKGEIGVNAVSVMKP